MQDLVDQGGDAVEEADVDREGNHDHVKFGRSEEEFEGRNQRLLGCCSRSRDWGRRSGRDEKGRNCSNG